MTNPNLTEIIVVLDRSGSMTSIKNDMEGGFNAFIAKQREVPKDIRVTLVQFDTVVETVYQERPVKDVSALELVPRGSTALYDALGKTINAVGSRLKAKPEKDRPHQVLFVIVTDGEENASQEFHAKQIQEMITTQRDVFSWEFIYLGANQDAFAVGHAIGVTRNLVGYAGNKIGTAGLWASVSRGAAEYTSSEQKTSGDIVDQAKYQAAVDALEVVVGPATPKTP